MSRYYFNIIAPDCKVLRDPEGQEFRNLAAVREEAIASAREIMAELMLLGQAPDGHTFEITDENDKVLLVVPFRSAIMN